MGEDLSEDECAMLTDALAVLDYTNSPPWNEQGLILHHYGVGLHQIDRLRLGDFRGEPWEFIFKYGGARR